MYQHTTAPVPLRKKANKLVAAKVKLAASVDVIGGKLEGGYGESVRKEIQQKLDTLAAPSKGRTKKALPAPIEKRLGREGEGSELVSSRK